MRDSSDARRYRALMVYEPDTGIFTWRHTLRRICRQGDVVGSKKGGGYLEVEYQGNRILLHRLAWLYVTGHWPRGVIDHINGIKHDNRICNLRDVDATINAQNRRSAQARSKSGLIGAHARKTGRFESRIKVEDRSVYIGQFDAAEDAHEAYTLAKRDLHDGCTI